MENKYIFKNIFNILDKANVNSYRDYRLLQAPIDGFPEFNIQLGRAVSSLSYEANEQGALDIGYAPFDPGKKTAWSSLPRDNFNMNQFYPFNVLSPLVSLSSSTKIITDEVTSGYNPHKADRWYAVPGHIVELIIAFRPYIENGICDVIPRQYSHQTLDDTGGFKPEEILNEISGVHIPLCFSSREVATLANNFNNKIQNFQNNSLIIPTLVGHPMDYIIELRNEYQEELVRFQQAFRKMIPLRGMRYTPQSIIDAVQELDDRVNDLRSKLDEVKRKHTRKKVEITIRLIISSILFFLPPQMAKIASIIIGTGTISEAVNALFIDPQQAFRENELYFAYLLTQ